MTQDAARPRFSARAGERLSPRNGARSLAPALPAAALAALAGAAFLWRVLAWQPAATVDAWAYAAWGQALARAERPLFELGATTPKPLAAVLGTLVSPLPADRAFAVVLALALAALAASLFAAAYREGGAVAAAVSVVVLAVGARLDAAVAFAYVDGVVAALVLAGIALRGRLRIGALVLAGLLRPEAWLVAAVAGFTETAGSLRRRAGAALAAGLAAPVLWMLADVVLMRDPLGTLHWHSERLGARDPTDPSWADVAPEYWHALTREGGAPLALAGMLGLGLHYVLARRRGAADPTPIAVAVVWSILPALQFGFGANLQPRYLLPLVAVLALGCGLLAAALVPSRLRVRSAWPAVVVAAGVVAIVVVSMDLRQGMLREMARNDAIAATRPAVESVLSCGRFGTTRRTARRGVIPQLAASTRRSLHEFGIYRGGRRFAGVLHFAPRRRPADPPLPSWPRRETPLGPLAVAPACPYSTASTVP
jgi:hypothetical protein